jgi:hypothetical protein
VLNSFLNGEWGAEEFHSNPFFHGKPFDVRIRVHEDNFDLLANHTPWATFKHRADFRQIDHIQVSGDLCLSAIHWGGRYFALPYEMVFRGQGFESGQRMFIHGIPRGDFALSLLGIGDNDVLFRMSAQFAKQKVTRNAQFNGQWGTEEDEDGSAVLFPFQAGEGFDLVIANEPVALQVFVNGHALCQFFHRTDDPHCDYKSLRVEGELELSGLETSPCWESIAGVDSCCKYAPKMTAAAAGMRGTCAAAATAAAATEKDVPLIA